MNVVSGLTLPLAYGQRCFGRRESHALVRRVSHRRRPATGAEAELGISVDQVAARHIGQDAPLPSLELSIEDGGLSCGTGSRCAYRNTISWQSPTSPLPMENNPQVVFERLFGDGSTAVSAAHGASRRAACSIR